MKAKIICGIIVVAMIASILYLTFQTPEQTTKLSESVRIWLENHGWEMTSRQIRSNIHIPIYFILGIAVFAFGYTMKWKWYVTLLLAISIALIDEGLKVFLPTREFDFKDLLKDLLGIGIAGAISIVFRYFRKQTA